MLSFRDAQAKILALAHPLPAERVALDDGHGRVLAEDVVARVALPRFDHSSMDGYAVRAADFAGDGPTWTFPVRGESRAGGEVPHAEAGAVCRIFTGAPLPEGTDAVVMQEDVERTAEGAARFAKRPSAGQFVRRRGDDLADGATALARGARLRPAHLGLAAALDLAWLTVNARPRVTLLATGDELRAPGTMDRPGTIAESNCVALRAMAHHAGAEARVAPFVPDDLEATARAFDEALGRSDVVLSIGGVSVGDHDVVRPALERIGVTLEFFRVAIKPGKPLAVGRRGRSLVLGLPGNPASAMVTFALFAAPLLRALEGERDPLPQPTRARLGVEVRRQAGRTEFARARLEASADGLVATPLPNQASGAVTSVAAADALLMIDADCTHLEAGAPVDVYLAGELGL